MFTKVLHILIMVAMATYFFPKIMKIVQIKPIFFILLLKRECKKNIRNVQKILYTYYHGYGNIFVFQFFLVNYEHFSNRTHFFYYYF